jgi:tripartite-type tricarboxylate transporter receptor subunit TctC
MMKKIVLCVSLTFLIAFLAVPGLLEAKPYYEGKIVNIIVGYAPGGGYDRMARIMAKHLPRYIPGKPTVLVQNMPGASSMITANYVYNMAKPDGLSIGTFNRYLTLSQLLKMDGVRFDLRKFAWVGSEAVEAAVFTVRGDMPYRTVEDLRKAKEPLFIGNTGEIDTGSQFAPLLRDFLGPNIKFVTYPQTADILLAIERKEVSGYGFTYTTAKPYIDRGMIRPLMRGPISAPGIENLPVNADLTSDQRLKTIVKILAAPDQLGRPFVAPPGTPPDIMEILRNAFKKVAEDPQVRDETKKMKMEVQYTPAPEVMKLIQYVLGQPADIAAEVARHGKF